MIDRALTRDLKVFTNFSINSIVIQKKRSKNSVKFCQITLCLNIARLILCVIGGDLTWHKESSRIRKKKLVKVWIRSFNKKIIEKFRQITLCLNIASLILCVIDGDLTRHMKDLRGPLVTIFQTVSRDMTWWKQEKRPTH